MIELAKLKDITPGNTLRVDTDGYRLCLLNIGGKIYALDDRCSHADYSLSEGMVDEDNCEIECPKHGAIFDVQSGEARSLPATQPVNTYEIVVEDDVIFLKVGQDA